MSAHSSGPEKRPTTQAEKGEQVNPYVIEEEVGKKELLLVETRMDHNQVAALEVKRIMAERERLREEAKAQYKADLKQYNLDKKQAKQEGRTLPKKPEKPAELKRTWKEWAKDVSGLEVWQELKKQKERLAGIQEGAVAGEIPEVDLAVAEMLDQKDADTIAELEAQFRVGEAMGQNEEGFEVEEIKPDLAPQIRGIVLEVAKNYFANGNARQAEAVARQQLEQLIEQSDVDLGLEKSGALAGNLAREAMSLTDRWREEIAVHQDGLDQLESYIQGEVQSYKIKLAKEKSASKARERLHTKDDAWVYKFLAGKDKGSVVIGLTGLAGLTAAKFLAKQGSQLTGPLGAAFGASIGGYATGFAEGVQERDVATRKMAYGNELSETEKQVEQYEMVAFAELDRDLVEAQRVLNGDGLDKGKLAQVQEVCTKIVMIDKMMDKGQFALRLDKNDLDRLKEIGVRVPKNGDVDQNVYDQVVSRLMRAKDNLRAQAVKRIEANLGETEKEVYVHGQGLQNLDAMEQNMEDRIKNRKTVDDWRVRWQAGKKAVMAAGVGAAVVFGGESALKAVGFAWEAVDGAEKVRQGMALAREALEKAKNSGDNELLLKANAALAMVAEKAKKFGQVAERAVNQARDLRGGNQVAEREYVQGGTGPQPVEAPFDDGIRFAPSGEALDEAGAELEEQREAAASGEGEGAPDTVEAPDAEVSIDEVRQAYPVQTHFQFFHEGSGDTNLPLVVVNPDGSFHLESADGTVYDTEDLRWEIARDQIKQGLGHLPAVAENSSNPDAINALMNDPEIRKQYLDEATDYYMKQLDANLDANPNAGEYKFNPNVGLYQEGEAVELEADTTDGGETGDGGEATDTVGNIESILEQYPLTEHFQHFDLGGNAGLSYIIQVDGVNYIGVASSETQVVFGGDPWDILNEAMRGSLGDGHLSELGVEMSDAQKDEYARQLTNYYLSHVSVSENPPSSVPNGSNISVVKINPNSGVHPVSGITVDLKNPIPAPEPATPPTETGQPPEQQPAPAEPEQPAEPTEPGEPQPEPNPEPAEQASPTNEPEPGSSQSREYPGRNEAFVSLESQGINSGFLVALEDRGVYLTEEDRVWALWDSFNNEHEGNFEEFDQAHGFKEVLDESDSEPPAEPATPPTETGQPPAEPPAEQPPTEEQPNPEPESELKIDYPNVPYNNETEAWSHFTNNEGYDDGTAVFSALQDRGKLFDVDALNQYNDLVNRDFSHEEAFQVIDGTFTEEQVIDFREEISEPPTEEAPAEPVDGGDTGQEGTYEGEITRETLPVPEMSDAQLAELFSLKFQHTDPNFIGMSFANGHPQLTPDQARNIHNACQESTHGFFVNSGIDDPTRRAEVATAAADRMIADINNALTQINVESTTQVVQIGNNKPFGEVVGQRDVYSSMYTESLIEQLVNGGFGLETATYPSIDGSGWTKMINKDWIENDREFRSLTNGMGLESETYLADVDSGQPTYIAESIRIVYSNGTVEYISDTSNIEIPYDARVIQTVPVSDPEQVTGAIAPGSSHGYNASSLNEAPATVSDATPPTTPETPAEEPAPVEEPPAPAEPVPAIEEVPEVEAPSQKDIDISNLTGDYPKVADAKLIKPIYDYTGQNAQEAANAMAIMNLLFRDYPNSEANTLWQALQQNNLSPEGIHSVITNLENPQ